MGEQVFHINESVTIGGSVITDDDVVVSGEVEGRITCRKLRIEPNAVVTGDLVADEVDLAGVVRGNVFAHVLYLRSSCEVYGDIFHGELQLDAGCFFEGKSRHVEDSRAMAD
ncbi:MAG: polymer-forming cytoskeletal protein [Pseudomonadota bacterium]